MLQIYEKIAEQIDQKRVFLTFLSLFLLISTFAFTQNENKVTIQQKKITVVDALKTVEKQSKMSINYSDSELKGKEIVNLNLQNVSVATALDAILKGTGFTYQIQGNYIIITEKKPTAAMQTVKDVKGKVIDENGEPLIGVNITVDGSTTGTITDFDGNFSIKALDNSKFKVSYIGYATQLIPVSKKDFYQIVMKQDTEVLDEVVVTALGIKRAEKALSYNVQQVKGDELTTIKDANFVNSLNGKIAGVNINKSASGVGGATRVVMRGAKSIEGDNNALYVVDGIPLFNTTMGNTDSGLMGEGKAGTEGIADFNPEDIESISVLSGPSAAALYGSSAANGVILITTKKGKEGNLSVQFSSSTEFSKAYMTPNFQNTYGNKKDAYDSWGEKLTTPSSYDPKDDFFNTGTNFINSVTLTTGTKQNQTFASISSTNSKGIVPNNSYDRLNFTVRNTSTFLNDKLQLDLGASYVKQKDKNMVSQGQYWNPVMAAYLFPRGESFEDIKNFERYDESRKMPVQYWPIAASAYASQNPYWTAYRNVSTNDKSRYMFNVGLTYKITDWLNAAARFRMDDTYVLFERKIYASSDQVFAEGKKGHYEYSNYNDRQEYADFMLNINKNILYFSIAANVGWNYSNYWALERGYKGPLLGVTNKFITSNIDPANGYISEKGGDSRVRNHAVFANVELGWKSMIYLTLTGRNDWNSRLVNTSEESFFYPSVGLSGIISEMVKLPEFISYLKVRGSFTEVGAPVSRSGLTPGTVTTPIVGGSLSPTYIYPFTNFKAERTKSYEFGLSLRLWNKLSAEVTYYHSNTKNQTFLGNLPEFTGYKQIYLQAGNVENRGWEASLSYSDKLKNGLAFSSTLTFSRNVNEIKEMVNNYQTDIVGAPPINIPEVLKDKGRVILKVGGSIHDIYANTFFKKDHLGFVDIKSDGSYGLERGESVYLGKTSPDFNMGWSNALSYKGFGVSFLINGRFGGVVTSSTEALLDRFGVSKRSAEARDAGGALIKGQGRVDAKTYYQMIGTGDYETSGYYVYKATNIRVQELTFSYTMPNKWFGNVLKDVALSFIASNPWMLYCKAPFDPELTPSTSTYGQGNDYFMQPSVRSFGFGVKFKL
ncbi:MAG: TonB-dependent receptor [Bacteroides xylanisolvens]